MNIEQSEDGSEQEDVSQAQGEDSMYYAVQDDENDVEWIDNAYANNDYVEFEEPLPDELEGDEWLNASVVENLNIGVARPSALRRDNIVFKVGDLFESKNEFVQTLKEWCIKRNVSFRPIKSNKSSYNVVCSMNQLVNNEVQDEASKNCPWRVHAASGKRTNGKFKITHIGGEHTCNNPMVNADHIQATSTFICNLIMPIVKTKLDATPADIMDRVHDMLWIRITYSKAWRARSKALSRIFGDWEKSYETLPQYLQAIIESNPGSVAKITTQNISADLQQFDSVFWAFGPSIEGFKHCRPVLSIDGTHLYGKYAGTLLVATGVDANGGLFPLAFAVVGIESKDVEWRSVSFIVVMVLLLL